MYIHQNTPPAATPIEGLEHVTLAGSFNGSRQLSVWQQILQPGSATPVHEHDCEELVMCSQGYGELHIDDEVFAFGPNSTITLPANQLHQLINVGDQPMHIVAVFPMTPVATYLPQREVLELPWAT